MGWKFWSAITKTKLVRNLAAGRIGRRPRLEAQSTETITWYSPATPPDAGLTVLVYVPDADEPIDFGFWDGEKLGVATLMPREAARIKAWAHLPEGRIP